MVMTGRGSSWLTLLLLIAAAGCTGAERETALTRAGLFQVGPGDPVQREVARPARAVAVYWPEPSCLSCQASARTALERAGSEASDIRVLSVLPGDGSGAGRRSPLPGELIELAPAEYSRQVRRLPAPRLEVWGDRGRRLLLIRRLPIALDHRALTEEILSTLSFSSSGEAAPGGGSS